MHLAVHIAFNVVNDIMHELLTQSVVTNPLVGVDLRVATDFTQDFALQGIAANVGNDLRPDFAHVTVKHSHDAGLVHVVALERLAFGRGWSCLLAFVHVGNAAPDKGFVYFNRASTFAHLSSELVLHSKTNA